MSNSLYLLTIPLIQRGAFGGTLFESLQGIQALIAPPITVIFLIGILNKRVNNYGAISSLTFGFILGMGRFILLLFKPFESTLINIFLEINFLHFALLLFITCSLILLLVSYMTKPPDLDKTNGLTYSKKINKVQQYIKPPKLNKTEIYILNRINELFKY